MNLPIEQKFLNIINNIIKIYPSFENYSNELHTFILKYKDNIENDTYNIWDFKNCIIGCDIGYVVLIPEYILLPDINSNDDFTKSEFIIECIRQSQKKGGRLEKIISLHYNVFDCITTLLFINRVKDISIIEITSFDWYNDDPNDPKLSDIWMGDLYTYNYILQQKNTDKFLEKHDVKY